jgi:phage tail-like protein
VSDLLRAFRFQVSLTRSGGGAPVNLGDGGFSECGGLSLDAELKDITQGGVNDRVTRLVGRVKLTPIVLKRGMFAQTDGGRATTELWDWFADTVGGVRPIRRYDGTISVLPRLGEAPMAVWRFDRGLPVKVAGPTLDARTGEIAIEELQIAHEGLRLDRAPGGRS